MTSVARLVTVMALACAVCSCSPGRLPGSPSPILTSGGGGRYNGTITYRRLGGSFTISEASQSLVLSIVLREADQMTGRFDAGETSGTLHGVITGSLGAGSFQATALVSTVARQGASTVTCQGRGEVGGVLSGANLTWTTGSILYDNCPGLAATSQVQAVAVSPIPGSAGTRATLSIAVLGSVVVTRARCADGTTGYPFVVEMVETSGINLTFDPTFRIEERLNFGLVSTNELDMPFRELAGGSRRTYQACSPVAGTYQAFFGAADANGNRIRVASPVVTMGP
jgi:hypothetical protein